MVQLIVGNKGSGKTKKLIDIVLERTAKSMGSVISIQKGDTLGLNLGTEVRLIDIEEYGISGTEAYYGFLAGLLAGNYDITDIVCDSTFRILSAETKDIAMLEQFLNRVETLGKNYNCKIVFSISMDEAELPTSLKGFVLNQ